MKARKTVLALVLAACMLFALLAACSNQTATPGTNDKQDAPATPTDPGSITTIEMRYLDFYSVGDDHGARITDAINAITEPQIGVHVNLQYVSVGNYMTMIQADISSGVQIDLIAACIGNNVANLHMSGMVMDITDYAAEYASDALALLGSYVEPYKYDGRLFGMPTYRNLLTTRFLMMNKDILDELGKTEEARNITTWTEFEALMQLVKENYTDQGKGIFPITAGAGAVLTHADNFWEDDSIFTSYHDALGDRTGTVYTDWDGNVSMVQEQPGWIATCKRTADWNSRGFIYPDSIINTDLNGDDIMRDGISFSMVIPAEYGAVTTKGGNWNKNLVDIEIVSPLLRTSSLTSWGMAVPITAEEPEAACKMLNLMYTNKDIANIFVNGVEGEDYTLENGEVVRQSGGYFAAEFVGGNDLLALPLKGAGADFNEVVLKKMSEMKTSPYLGFSINVDDLSLAVSQMTTVNSQYNQTVAHGNYTDEIYQEYVSKLETAGVRDYLAAVQTQLDAWRANH